MRWQTVVLSVVAASAVAQSSMEPTEVEAFKSRIGWSTIAPPDLSAGVRADWSTLSTVLDPMMRPLRFESGRFFAIAPGLVKFAPSWSRGDKLVLVWVFVSGDGPSVVREKMISLVAETMRRTIPYVRGPKDLGDISIRHARGTSDTILWAFNNVCVQVSNQGTGVDIVPIAHAIHGFMTSHLTSAVAAFIPRVDAYDVVPSPVQVGAQVRVSVKLPQGSGPALSTDFEQASAAILGPVKVEALSATFLAKAPGHTRVGVTLIDGKTLLSSQLDVPVEVLP